MKSVIELINAIFSPKVVLVLFAITACVGFLQGKLDIAVFGGALMAVLSFYYGSKQGEAAASLANAQVNAANKILDTIPDETKKVEEI